MADQHQQHLNDDVRLERRGQLGRAAGSAARLAGAQLLSASLGGGGEIDIDAANALAAGPSLAHGGEQEGMHGDVQQGPELLVGATVGGVFNQALDGGGEGAVAGEMHGTEREQAEAVKAGRVPGGVEAAVVVVTAQVANLAEVAEGGPAGRLAKGILELLEGDMEIKIQISPPLEGQWLVLAKGLTSDANLFHRRAAQSGFWRFSRSSISAGECRSRRAGDSMRNQFPAAGSVTIKTRFSPTSATAWTVPLGQVTWIS